MRKRIRGVRFNVLLFALVAWALVLLPQTGAACERCSSNWEVILSGGQSWCHPVTGDEVGSTICTSGTTAIGGSYCSESGNFCNSITIGGGGGGGGTGGGGGGSSCSYQGYCPAECFSCGGGAPKY
jgi:hypothetical protein